MELLRLKPSDLDIAKAMFALLALVFDEQAGALTDEYIRELLARDSFWAVAALDGKEVVGGITAHTLPMTSSQDSELFVYDLAVKPEQQRRGIGRQLVNELRALGAAAGVTIVFVPADGDDTEALRFYRAIGGAESAVKFFTFGE